MTFFRDITSAQDNLRGMLLCATVSYTSDSVSTHAALLARVKSVQGDVDKLSSENETLQMYIDNLTMQMAKRR